MDEKKILELRSAGKSYKEIKTILGCSSGTIAYHCGVGQKEKSKNRHRQYDKTLNAILKRKKDNFSFVNGTRHCAKKRGLMDFSINDFRNKLLTTPICYLSGRLIDVLNPKTYHCDHIIPVSKGGTCKFENLGFACKSANMAKGEMTVDEFIILCKDVLVHHGFTVLPPQ